MYRLTSRGLVVCGVLLGGGAVSYAHLLVFAASGADAGVVDWANALTFFGSLIGLFSMLRLVDKV